MRALAAPLRPALAAAAALLGPQLAPAEAIFSLRSFDTTAATAAAAAGPPAAAAAWQQRFEGIAPGSVLRVALPDCAAELAVSVGEHEAIELASSSCGLAATAAPHDGHPGSTAVTVGAAEPSAAAALAQPLRVHVRAPSRFLTLEAATGGGGVSVEVIQEGSVRISTRGGDIAVPKIKAVDAHLASGGGAIRGSVTGVDVRLRSAGGPVQLRSLVGKRVELSSGGGAVALGACYADQLHVQSGGGPIQVTNMDCRSGAAALRSSGGAVTVDSLDGNLAVDSEGGDVQVQLHDNAGSVTIASGGGDIRLFLNPAVAGRLLLRNAGRVAARPGTVQVAQPQEDGGLLLPLPLGSAMSAVAAAEAATRAPAPPLSRLQRGAAGAQQQQQQQHGGGPPPGNAISSAGRGAAPGGADIVLDAGGSGTISISERGWMDALRQRYS